MKGCNRLCCALALVLLCACQKPASLADEFPKHAFLTLDELGARVRLSFSGPNLEQSQPIDEAARKDASFFVLLDPVPVWNARTVDSRSGDFEAGKVSFCARACAQVLRFRDQGAWVKGEVCRQGPVLAPSTIRLPQDSGNEGRVYATSGISFPGHFTLPDQVVCYETYFFHEGETRCEQSCSACGAGEFRCVFYAPSLGYLPAEMPEEEPSSTFETDCDTSDKTECGPGIPGDGGPEQPPA